jgi:hypothetical protein
MSLWVVFLALPRIKQLSCGYQDSKLLREKEAFSIPFRWPDYFPESSLILEPLKIAEPVPVTKLPAQAEGKVGTTTSQSL